MPDSVWMDSDQHIKQHIHHGILATVCANPITDYQTVSFGKRLAVCYDRIDLIDNCIDFDEKYLDRIFQVFKWLHGKHEFAGTGIGLEICEKVVTNHGGAITASSRVGEGSTFSVYLPLNYPNEFV